MYSEEQLIRYSKYLSNTEDQKCAQTIRTIKRALRKFQFDEESTIDVIENADWSMDKGYSRKFYKDNLTLSILLQGSYANRTCVRNESDVDIALIVENPLSCELMAGTSLNDYGLVDSPEFNILKFKGELVSFLKGEFGYNFVIRHNKSINLKSNGTRKDADIVPCYRYNNYDYAKTYDADKCCKGIEIIGDDGCVTINYPELHIQNAILKNDNTSRRYKRIVRILKHIMYDFQDNSQFNNISSFGIECMLFNVPDSLFYKNSYALILQNVLSYLIHNRANYPHFKEVNRILYVFRKGQHKNPNEYFNFFIEVYKRI